MSDPSGEDVPGPVIVLPPGETVRVELTSDDAIHAFWVPGLPVQARRDPRAR